MVRMGQWFDFCFIWLGWCQPRNSLWWRLNSFLWLCHWTGIVDEIQLMERTGETWLHCLLWNGAHVRSRDGIHQEIVHVQMKLGELARTWLVWQRWRRAQCVLAGVLILHSWPKKDEKLWRQAIGSLRFVKVLSSSSLRFAMLWFFLQAPCYRSPTSARHSAKPSTHSPLEEKKVLQCDASEMRLYVPAGPSSSRWYSTSRQSVQYVVRRRRLSVSRAYLYELVESRINASSF